MTKRFLAPVVLIFCLTCGVCTSAIGQHLIVALQGQVSLKRNDWSRDRYVPAMFGTSLQRGDLLRLEGSSQAKVVCAGLTVYDAPRGISGVPCLSVPPILKYGGSLMNPTRSVGSAFFPIVVSPRKTKLLNPRPKLSWTPVDGASGYLVIVRGPGLNWEQSVRAASAISYPESAPAVKPGESYKLIVCAKDQCSDQEDGIGFGFSVVAPNEEKVLRREEARIRKLGLPSATTDFLVAYLYASHGLNADAIELLETLSKSFEEPAVARLIGDLYQTVGLARQAESWYSTALKWSQNLKDEEGQAVAHQSLARIYERGLGNFKYAMEHLRAALALADKLGDQRRAREIKQSIAELQRPKQVPAAWIRTEVGDATTN